MADSSSILIVDNDPVRQQAAGRLLSAAGLLVHASASGQEALDRVGEIHPDVVLLSGKLSDICAVEMCRRLRALPEFTSLILLRDSAKGEAAAPRVEGGPDAWLPERCGVQALLSTVRALVRLHQAEMELSAAKQRSESAAQTAQQSCEQTEGFAFQACHDLEEPVRALSAFSHMIGNPPGRLSPDETMFLEQAVAGTSRLRRLFANFLSYSQIPRDHKPVAKTVDLDLAARAAIYGLGKTIRDSAAEVHVTEPLPAVSGNFARLQQVFECLLTNAIQYRRPEQQPVIQIGAREGSQNDTVISVADNGIGIGSQYHQAIFQPFKRLHGREIPGSGMGLAICRGIVEAHRGRIWVESEPGAGATFFFSLNKAAAS